jgi:pseudaminic acid biosynthesis-associated methylase
VAAGERRTPEALRLEGLWAGDFGDAYTIRNETAGADRGKFWTALFASHPIASVLEVGCNVGANLQWIAKHVDSAHIYGVDVNAGALDRLHQRLPAINAIRSIGRELPFRDRWFDLVFTSGVLIHQPDSTLPLVMSEVVRVSRKLVLALEYAAEESVEVPYRGQEGALFKRDYTGLYHELFPELELVGEGFLGHAEGWAETAWCLYARP